MFYCQCNFIHTNIKYLKRKKMIIVYQNDIVTINATLYTRTKLNRRMMIQIIGRPFNLEFGGCELYKILSQYFTRWILGNGIHKRHPSNSLVGCHLYNHMSAPISVYKIIIIPKHNSLILFTICFILGCIEIQFHQLKVY